MTNERNNILIATATLGKRPGYLEKNIQSVANQENYKGGLVHLVIDNSPNRAARGVVRACYKNGANVLYHCAPVIEMAAAARNAALFHPVARRSEVIKWLDDDDYFWTNQAVAKLQNELLSNETVMAYGQQVYVKSDDTVIKIEPREEMDRRKVLIRDSFPCSTMAFRITVLASIGGFGWMKSSEDLELVLRVMEHANKEKRRIGFICEPIAAYRKHDGGVGFANRQNGEKDLARRRLRLLYTKGKNELEEITALAEEYKLGKVAANAKLRDCDGLLHTVPDFY